MILLFFCLFLFLVFIDRVALIPIYAVGILIVINQFYLSRGSLWIFVYLIAVVLALLPAHLFEFRYFTAGIVIGYLNIPSLKITNKINKTTFELFNIL